MPLFRDRYDVSDEILEELRSKFFEEINSGPEAASKYHPDDIERVRENGWFICRYLLHQEMNVDNAFKMMRESLQFRNEMEINTITKESLPEAYFEARTLQIYNHDKNNRPIIAIRGKAHKKCTDEIRLHQQYMLYWVEKAVRSADWGSLAIIFDCTDATYKNVDLDMIKFILNAFKLHYPWAMHIFLVYNMPWYLSALWKVIKQLVPEKHASRIVFTDDEGLLEYVEKDQLPVCMGGTCTDQYDTKDFEEQSASSKTWF